MNKSEKHLIKKNKRLDTKKKSAQKDCKGILPEMA